MIPIYYQIKRTIRGWIINKEFSPGEKIPSDNMLAKEFNVSRLTVRHAISQLVQEGFLKTKRGEGTFVVENRKLSDSFNFEFVGFMNDLISKEVAKIKIKSVIVNRISPTKIIRDKLQLNEDTKEVIQIKRERLFKGRPFSYATNYLPIDIGSRINEKDLYKRPLMQILETDFGIKFSEAVQTIEASFADQETAEKLEIVIGAPILVVERVIYDEDQKPIDMFYSANIGEKYKFIVRFKKVRKKHQDQWVNSPE
jgi:GntR family transcriptional regulator